ncbi:hypothetical protein [Enterorhabdus sp. P55]|uniref:hypothetical protein n=1 Tax=Enterorhabdus sp. P55 TaxID=2304571 RepID=UPI0013710A9B|nr:hypothetical protein [Enterorhabdus sp. P55]NBI31765.1 hypothetical protein [Enterorhabdus sp. P55]
MSTKPEESDLLASLKAALGGKGVKEAREAAEEGQAAPGGVKPACANAEGTTPDARPAPGAPAPATTPAPTSEDALAEAASAGAASAEPEADPASVATQPTEDAPSPEELQAAEERARFVSELRACEDILNAVAPQER